SWSRIRLSLMTGSPDADVPIQVSPHALRQDQHVEDDETHKRRGDEPLVADAEAQRSQATPECHDANRADERDERKLVEEVAGLEPPIAIPGIEVARKEEQEADHQKDERPRFDVTPRLTDEQGQEKTGGDDTRAPH